jgi:hypothetical protein
MYFWQRVSNLYFFPEFYHVPGINKQQDIPSYRVILITASLIVDVSAIGIQDSIVLHACTKMDNQQNTHDFYLQTDSILFSQTQIFHFIKARI